MQGASQRTWACQDSGAPRGLQLAPLHVQMLCPALGGGRRAAASPGFLTVGPAALTTADPDTIDREGSTRESPLLAKGEVLTLNTHQKLER